MTNRNDGLASFMPLATPGSGVANNLANNQHHGGGTDVSFTEPSIPQLVLSPLFVDNLAKDFGLTAVQRNHVHTCAQLGSVNEGLTKADLSTRLFMLAVCYSESNEMRRAAERNNTENLAQLLEDLRVRLDDGYTFTRDQMRSIRSQAQDSIYEPTRTSFMSMHNDVLQKLRDNKGPTKLSNVFGNPSREKALASLVKKTCSSVRNSLRQDIRNSICGDTPSTLSTFTYTSASKFKRGGPGLSLDIGYTIHNAHLRRFAIENPSIIGVEDVVEDEDSNDDPGSSPAPASKKRKLNTAAHAGGRIPKGKDFWSQVDAFFATKIHEFGSKNLQSPGWKEYNSETIRRDEQRFPNDNQQREASPAVSSSESASGSNAPRNGPAAAASNLFQLLA
ncbi:hypothetical protein B0H17DRAFT_1201703 [Mycena rosella]|uniref:Uncharacterized protein n=1 Tax=Mycena rosella TaxID=1033263 RepID=A0AAD7DCF4_MYCRO|nr:hypothetical protein B0H17DRAFT_1203222 [Mycena rosella]KAJ7690359.1 hypothetical protein B0H17DRAFT_1201703 [Mycena rosella]